MRGIAIAAEGVKRFVALSGVHSIVGVFNNLSIQVKASAASILLLICLLGLGANAYLTSTRSAAGLRVLTNVLTPKQQAFSQVSDEVFTTHLKIFRFVSWESNGVSDTLLKPLYAEINSDLDSLSDRITALAQRLDLSNQERATMQQLLAKWAIGKSHAKDTIDVGQHNSALAAPMATMMLGETDDSFEAVNADLQNLSLAVTATVNNLSNQLYADAARTKDVIILVTLAGFLISTFVAFVVGRSIVRPIEAVTDVMQRLSGGEVDVAIGHRDRHDEIGSMVDAIEVFRKNIIDKQAIEQTLTAELARSVEELRALAEVSQTVNSTLDLETVLSAIVGKATQLSGTEAGTIYVFSETRREHQLRATYGMTDSLIAAIKDQHSEISNAIALAVERGQLMQTPDLRAEPPSVARDIMLRAGYLARLIVPLLAADRIVGALVVRRQAPGEFPKNTIALLQTFAGQSVLAIQNARLFSELRQRSTDLSKSLEDLRTTQDRLVQTQKLASLGQLTAGIAHEIKNPLNFVNNFSGVSVELIDELREILGRVATDKKTHEEIAELADTLRDNLDKIAQHGKRADSIVKNMLLHSREGSGERRPVNVNALVDESLNLAYHGARAEKHGFNITLERAFDPTVGEIEAFPQEISRVLLNLIANGFYAANKRVGTGEGFEPTLAAATKNLGDRVEISIRDNGTGIPPEVKERMFNPFFTTKPAGEGTGLGLSLSHDIIVKQHSGSIEVDTEPGAFTEFRIILPRAAAKLPSQ